MAFHQRDIISAVNSLNSRIESALDLTPTSTSETASSTKSAKTTTSSSPSTTSTNATSTVKSTASSTAKSTAAASSSTDSAAASTITSTSSTASSSSTSISSSPSSSASPTSSITSTSTHSPTSTLLTTTTSTPAPTSTVLPSSSTASGNQVSTVGIAVASVFAALILTGIFYLLWKYLPACRRRRERAYQLRSHRDGLSYAGPRKGLAFIDEEEASDLHLDDPQLGLGLRKYDFHTAPTYYPGQSQHGADSDLSQRRPLTSMSEEHDIVSPLSTRSVRSQISQSTLPSALQAGPQIYPFPQHFQYQDVRASQIGVAVGSVGGSVHEMQREGDERPGSSREKGLPPLPLPSMGYGKAFP